MASTYTLKSKKVTVAPNQMRDALEAIARELQPFRSQSSSTASKTETIDHEDLERELETCKSKIKVKRGQIHKLKHNLMTACGIAETVMAAKEKEAATFNNHLESSRHESATLQKKNNETIEMIQNLSTENQLLNDKLQNISNFIEIGYRELQKIRNEVQGDMSVILMLRHIMICCGEYYADFCNEHEKCIQLDQKNQYLTNKLHILESILQTTTGNLKNLQNIKVQRRALVDRKSKGDGSPQTGFVSSEIFGSQNCIPRDPELIQKCESYESSVSKLEKLDLTSHLSLVKNMLNDQETMLKDLKELTQELSNPVY